ASPARTTSRAATRSWRSASPTFRANKPATGRKKSRAPRGFFIFLIPHPKSDILRRARRWPEKPRGSLDIGEGGSLSVYELKPRFQSLLRPLTARLYAAGVTANQVTVFACVVSVALGALLTARPDPRLFLLIPAWLFLRMAFNAIDGML